MNPKRFEHTSGILKAVGYLLDSYQDDPSEEAAQQLLALEHYGITPEKLTRAKLEIEAAE